ncbi:hypothetical protein ACQSSU_15325 [Micromonospora echinospora]
MPEPQPGAQEPAAGNTPAPPPSVTEAREQVVPGEPDPSAVPTERTLEQTPDGPAGEPATEENPAGPDRTAVDTARPEATSTASGATPPRGAAKVPAPAERKPAPSAPDPTRLDPVRVDPTAPEQRRPDATRVDRAGPDPTKLDASPAVPPAPRWSGSAAVPPPKPKKRGWGHSAEPTPPPVPPPTPPESLAPVDPWAGVDTGSWDLNAGYEPLPPTRMYPAATDSPAWTPPDPPAPAWTPPPVAPQPPPVAPVSGQPVSPPAAHPVSPPAPARPVSPPPQAHPAPPPPQARPVSPPAARPVSPPAFPPPAPAPQARPVSAPPPAPARPVSVPPPPVSAPPRPVSAPPPARPVAPPPQRRNPTPPPGGPPPNWQAPQGYAPRPPRKKRRWPTRMLIMSLLSIACCCGCPAWFGKPMWDQYPVGATLPPQVADLRLQTDARSEQTADELRGEVETEHTLAEEVFAGVYSTPQGKTVTIFGSTGFRFTPESDAEEELTRLTPKYKLGTQQVVETDVRGEHQRCAVGRSGSVDVVVCTWADHGSLASGVFTRLSLSDSATLLGRLREQIVTRQ